MDDDSRTIKQMHAALRFRTRLAGWLAIIALIELMVIVGVVGLVLRARGWL